MAITFDKPGKCILITAPQIEVTIQDLVDAIRDYEEILDNFDITHIAQASGKEDLGGGVLVGITLELLDGWRVIFEDRAGPSYESMSITGGNIVAINAFNNNPVKPSAFTQVSITSSSSATISQLEIIDLAYKIESLRTSHGRFGDNVYWDPIGGDDAQVGDTPIRAVKTFAQAHSIANGGDVIYGITDNAVNGIVETNDKIVITKDGISFRGPGNSFILNHTSGSGPTVQILANSVELSGFEIMHDAGATLATYGIHIDGNTAANGADNISLKNIKIKETKGDGIFINDSGDSKFNNIFIEDCDGDGIEISNNVDDLFLDFLVIDRAGGDGINITGTSVLDTLIRNSEIHDSGDYGLDIGSGASQTVIRSTVIFFDNTNGPIRDQGSFTTIESFQEETATFQGAVHINTSSSTTGTKYPIGIPSNPVNNISDARIIADFRGIREYNFHGSITLDQNHTDWTFLGISGTPTVDFNGFSVNDSRFIECTITGNNSGAGTLEVFDGNIINVTNLDGLFTGCGLNGTNLISSGGNPLFFNCHSNVPGTGTPILDFNATNSSSGQFRAYTGGIEIRNFDQVGDNLSIDLVSGNVKLATTCTNGTIVIRGVGGLEDNSTGSTIVTTGSALGLSIGRFRGRVAIDTVNGVSGTTFPTGTDERPVNNLTDALTIASNNGFNTFSLIDGTLSVSGAIDVSNHRFIGEGAGATVLVFSDGLATTNNITIQNLIVAGALNGTEALFENCLIGIESISLGLSGFSGIIFDSVIAEDITLIGTGAAGLRGVISRCSSIQEGGTPVININGEHPLIMTKIAGRIEVAGKTGSEICRIGMDHGVVTLSSSNTGGTISLEGTCKVIDNSMGSTIDTELVMVPSYLTDVKDEAFGRWVLDHNTDTLTLYKADGVTVLKSFTLGSTNDNVSNYISRTPV